MNAFICPYCKLPANSNGAYSKTWQAYAHKDCVFKRLLIDPLNQEALVFARDVLSFQDGLKIGAEMEKQK